MCEAGFEGVQGERNQNRKILLARIGFDTAEEETRKVWITGFADHTFRSHLERLVFRVPERGENFGCLPVSLSFFHIFLSVLRRPAPPLPVSMTENCILHFAAIGG